MKRRARRAADPFSRVKAGQWALVRGVAGDFWMLDLGVRVAGMVSHDGKLYAAVADGRLFEIQMPPAGKRCSACAAKRKKKP